VPGLKLGDEQVKSLLTFLSKTYQLKTLDLSWNSFLPSQVQALLKSLEQNETLQYLNLAMTPIPESADIRPLTKHIKHNMSLLHLNLSGMFTNPDHIQKIMIKIKLSRTLLSLHLSHTPALHNNPRLHAYIRKKLGCNKLDLRPPKNYLRVQAINDFVEQRNQFYDMDNINRQLKDNESQLNYYQSQQY
jgi:Ran GTPase-activating protein (RanGAP) involved in mRNA processing and transport